MRRNERNTQVPLEDEFVEWLHRRKLLSHSTARNHLARLRRLIADYDLRGIFFAVVPDKNISLTQRYYKEFLCEYFAHILLPLLREHSSSTPASPEEPHQQHGESPHERTR